MLGAVLIVGALSLLTITAIDTFAGDDGDDSFTVGLGVEQPPDDDGDGDGDEPAAPRATTTTTQPAVTTTTTAGEAEVLGDVTSREPGVEDADDPPASATPPPTPEVTSPPPTSPPPPAPPTTVCQDSGDPACGTFRWEPQPADDEVEVEEVSVPLRAEVGQEVTLAVDVVERAGAEAIGACASWTVDDPGVPNVSTCEAVNHSCDRYGPHQPPPPADDRVPVARTVTFTEPGEREIQVGGHTATHLPDGCANPYLSSWSRTYVIVVEPAA